MFKFVLYRILGNNLPPRHGIGQTFGNLKFILNHEPIFPDCEKRWVVNRIVDQDQEEQIISLLDKHGQKYIHIPFVLDEYAEQPYDIDGLPSQFFLHRATDLKAPPLLRARALEYPFRYKNLYAMNNNGARNAALEEGRLVAEWVMPFDGNCYFTQFGWEALLRDMEFVQDNRYLIVPMTRVHNNLDLLHPNFSPNPLEEPQIAFRGDAVEIFDENKRYGFNPKADLLRRLHVPGPWERWGGTPWEPHVLVSSSESGKFHHAGWVARLSSEAIETEKSENLRAISRINGIVRMLGSLDERALRTRFNPENLVFYDETVLSGSKGNWKSNKNVNRGIVELAAMAESLLRAGPYSVMEKTSLPPSSDKHDYLNPAPYWWRDPTRPDSTAQMHDGKRLPENELYSPESGKYDRTRLQLMFDQTTILALAWYFSDDDRFADHAALMIRTWFLNPSSRMNPHLRFAQIRLGEQNEQSGFGIVETKDFYYFLDAVRLISRSGKLSQSEQNQFRQWCRKFLDWLLNSNQGMHIFMSQNNMGTYYDLQVASLAAFLDDTQTLLQILRISSMRAAQQFMPDGSQPEELKRTNSLHYSVFNLQGWFNLSKFGKVENIDLWNTFISGSGCPAKGLAWILGFPEGKWPYQQLDGFDYERLALLHYLTGPAVADEGAVNAELVKMKGRVRAVFHPYAGIQPFWNLGI